MPIIHAGFEYSLPGVRVQKMTHELGCRSFPRFPARSTVSSCRRRPRLLVALSHTRKSPFSMSSDLSRHDQRLTSPERNTRVSFIGRLPSRPLFGRASVPTSPLEDEHRLPSRFMSMLHCVRREAGMYTGLTSETQSDPSVPARDFSMRGFFRTFTPPRILSAIAIQPL